MWLRPKYTREKEEGRCIQRSGSLISTFFMHCRSQRLVLAAGDDLFDQFHVLNTLLGSIHGFLHQPSALDAQLVILVHKFLDDDAGPLQQGSGLLLLLALPTIFALSRSCSAQSFALLSFSCRMTPVACSNEAFMLSCNLAQPEI